MKRIRTVRCEIFKKNVFHGKKIVPLFGLRFRKKIQLYSAVFSENIPENFIRKSLKGFTRFVNN